MPPMNGHKVSHRKLGEAVASIGDTLNQHAEVINGQKQRLDAYGRLVTDLLKRVETLEQAAQPAELETA